MNTNKQLVEAVLESAGSEQDSDERKQLTCAEAFELAKRFEAEIVEIGRICNQHDIKIRTCQLGCFA